MAERGFSVGTYLLVLAALVILTVATVAISFFELSSPWHLVAGMSIAVAKASLVVLFFMHALVSPRLTWGVIGTAVFWLSLLGVLMYADYFSRSLIPFMPGH
ncbi:MAG TPA: cytochrome C oxidase subunit IV family protein [Pirellulales bacterium]|jgi:cytochrome c oxidase subunit 4|nr:cytochrome C oxidase subunit IV family protein [Pirellulales bacterium]